MLDSPKRARRPPRSASVGSKRAPEADQDTHGSPDPLLYGAQAGLAGDTELGRAGGAGLGAGGVGLAGVDCDRRGVQTGPNAYRNCAHNL